MCGNHVCTTFFTQSDSINSNWIVRFYSKPRIYCLLVILHLHEPAVMTGVFFFCMILSGLGSWSDVRSWWRQDMTSGSRTRRTSLCCTGRPSTTAWSWSSKVFILRSTRNLSCKSVKIVTSLLDNSTNQNGIKMEMSLIKLLLWPLFIVMSLKVKYYVFIFFILASSGAAPKLSKNSLDLQKRERREGKITNK